MVFAYLLVHTDAGVVERKPSRCAAGGSDAARQRGALAERYPLGLLGRAIHLWGSEPVRAFDRKPSPSGFIAEFLCTTRPVLSLS